MQLAWDEEDSTQVAIKFVARGSAYLSRAAEREILNHRLLTGHAHIVQFKEVRSRVFSLGFRKPSPPVIDRGQRPATISLGFWQPCRHDGHHLTFSG